MRGKNYILLFIVFFAGLAESTDLLIEQYEDSLSSPDYVLEFSFFPEENNSVFYNEGLSPLTSSFLRCGKRNGDRLKLDSSVFSCKQKFCIDDLTATDLSYKTYLWQNQYLLFSCPLSHLQRYQI